MKKIIIATLIPFLVMPLMAKAQWSTRTDDDIFNNSKKAMLIGTLNNSSSAVILDCTKKTLSIAYVEPDETTKIEEDIPVDLIVKIDKNDSVTLNAVMSRRNDSAISAESDDVEAIKQVLKSLHDAKQKILVGVQSKDGGNQDSFSGGVANSRNSVNKFISACEIQL